MNPIRGGSRQAVVMVEPAWPAVRPRHDAASPPRRLAFPSEPDPGRARSPHSCRYENPAGGAAGGAQSPVLWPNK